MTPFLECAKVGNCDFMTSDPKRHSGSMLHDATKMLCIFLYFLVADAYIASDSTHLSRCCADAAALMW